MPEKPKLYRFRDHLPANGEGKTRNAAPPASVDEAGIGHVYLYDVIDSWGGFWGTSAAEFAEVLATIPADTSELRVHVNSPGGEVYEAIAIKNLLAQHGADKKVAVVDGLAASAASFIAASADELVMGENSELMIHDALMVAYGNAADYRGWADELDRVSDNIASIYAKKSGGETADWRAVMIEEKWYSAQDAVDAGLADRVGFEAAEETQDQIAARRKAALLAVGAKYEGFAAAKASTAADLRDRADAEESGDDQKVLDELAAIESRHLARAHAVRERAQRG